MGKVGRARRTPEERLAARQRRAEEATPSEVSPREKRAQQRKLLKQLRAQLAAARRVGSSVDGD